jgi:2-dehydro-3-deoxygluconokinase
VCFHNGETFKSKVREDLEIYDRVGGGDSFASGLIFGFLTDKGPQWAVDCGAAHGALAMTTPGDTSMTTIDEVLQAMEKQTVRISR